MTGSSVRVERFRGSAAEFHAREVPRSTAPLIWSFDILQPALVLGSTQSIDLVDLDAARVAGVEVVRRRSGGGAVWLVPGDVTWIDVILPSSHPRWTRDVSNAALWLGQCLAEVIDEQVGSASRVHVGPPRRTPWSDLVCFAGAAAGEVSVDGAKVVGISQRRTRDATRFQCALLHRWDPAPMIDLLRVDASSQFELGRALRGAARGIGPVSVDCLVDRIGAALMPLD